MIQHVGQIVELIMIHLDFNSQEKVIWLFDKILKKKDTKCKNMDIDCTTLHITDKYYA